jgi:multimeric flavodoxin WrbA
MTKVLVLYASSYGHIEQMAGAIAEGALASGAEVDIRRVPETAPPEVVEAAHFKTATPHQVIEGPDKLAEYDGIVVGAPTRYGRMPGQMAAFWDTTGGLWMSGALIGKVGAAFTSTGGQLTGKKATVILASGGDFSPGSPVEGYNQASGYLCQVLGFIGITDLEIILAGRTRAGIEGETAVEQFGEAVSLAAAA